MKLLSPDVFRRLYASKELNEIISEKKRIETKITTLKADKDPVLAFDRKTPTQTPAIQETKEDPIEVKGTGVPEDMVDVTTDGEHSELSLYMEYSKILTEFINMKNEYMNEAGYKAKLAVMNNEQLMDVRNKLVDDVNSYYKETNSMRTKEMLYSIPFLKFLVKDKNVNENVDNLDVIMKKEDYVKYIDELLEAAKQKEVEAKQREIAEKNK